MTDSRHHLSAQCFTELAVGSGSASSVAELRSGQRSRAMLLLRALVEVAAAHPALPGPLPPAGEAWRLLIRAERRSPAAVERLLLHPQTGVWLSRCLRRLRGQEPADAPLWSETGYLYAMAASAALLAGIDFRIAVVVRDGGVMLPALGFALVPDRAPDLAEVVGTAEGTAAVVAGPHTVPLPASGFADDAPGWHGLRRLRGDHRGHSCSPFLDDLDPYRDFFCRRPPDRLTDDAWKHWQERFAGAWRLVAEQRNVDPSGLAACIASVVPVPYAAHPEPFSASSPEAYGCVLMDGPVDEPDLAAALVHEAQHIKLSALMDLVPLIEGGREEVHHAPWRLDPRPLRGLLQGVYAFLGVTGFWQDRLHRTDHGPDGDTAAFEFALRREQTAHGLETLRTHAELTPLGESFLDQVAERLADWLAEPVPSVPRRLAADLVVDHRLVYRMRHLRPEPAPLARWVGAWRTRGTPPRQVPPASVESAPAEAVPRTALARLRFTEPERLRDAPERLRAGQGCDGADLAWARGDRAAALHGYRGRLARDPDDVAAWAGLALTLPDGAARAALLRAPETVLAVHRALRDGGGEVPDPVALATWIGDSL
ncbi:HEXXH motif domain-containing protein [Streptomyces sp. NPDC059850]|uniref:HEXXH motif domain-containing protein n=1 Tax=Streptomyces sp. NPDC059850 TaxID=3346970 RepID=UPI003654CA56